MKTRNHLYALLAAMAVAACTEPVNPEKPDGPDGPGETPVYTTTLKFAVAEGVGISFELNDEISVFNGVGEESNTLAAGYVCTSISDGVAVFEFAPGNGVTEIDKTHKKLAAVFPAMPGKEADYSNNFARVEYNGQELLFGVGTPENTIVLQKACGAIDVVLTGESSITSIELKGTENLTGNGSVDFSSQKAVLSIGEGNNAIKKVFEPAVNLTPEGVAFHFIVPAGEQEYTIVATDSNGGSMDPIQTNIKVEVGEVKTINAAYFVPTKVTGVEIPNGIRQYLLKAGEAIDAKEIVSVVPADATNKGLTFLSDKSDVASIDDNGIITAKAKGDAQITVSSAENSEFSITLIVRVADIPEFEEVKTSAPAYLHTCDDMQYMTKTDGAEIRTAGPKEGSGWFYREVNKQAEWMVVSRVTAVVDPGVMSLVRTHLAFDFNLVPYSFNNPKDPNQVITNNAQKLIGRLTANKGKIELSHAGGGGASQHLYWYTKGALENIKDGWNTVDLALKDAMITDGYSFNPKGTNWFRMYIDGPAALYDEYHFGFDGIRLYEDYTYVTDKEKTYFHDFTNVNGFNSPFYSVKEKAVGDAWNAGVNVFSIQLQEAVDTKVTQAKGHLHFKLYISDVNAFNDYSGQLELSSSGTCDQQEICWLCSEFLKYCHNGWNDIVLDLSRCSAYAADFDLSNLNWFRLYNPTASPVTIMFKDIYLFNE